MAELKIESEKDFKAWLEGKPREVSVVLASRIALRFFPMVVLASDLQNFSKTFILPTLCANILPWVAAKYPAHSKNLDYAAASDFAGDICSGTSSGMMVYIVQPIRMAMLASHAAHNAIIAGTAKGAARSAGSELFGIDSFLTRFEMQGDTATHAAHAATFWGALTADCRRLENEGTHAATASALAGMPLWPDGVPDWVEVMWRDLKRVLLDAGDSWQVWINWYEARLHGRPTITAPADIVQKLDLDIALIDETFWKAGPSALNAEMQRLIDKVLAEARERAGDVEADENEIKLQEKASPQRIVDNFETVSLNVLGVLEVVRDERKAHSANKPNEHEQLEEWQKKDSFYEVVEGKLDEIYHELEVVEAPEEIPEASEKVATLLDEYRDELDNWLRENKKEMVNWAVRLPVITLSIGLLSLAEVPPLAALPVAVALGGGDKVFNVLKQLKGMFKGE